MKKIAEIILTLSLAVSARAALLVDNCETGTMTNTLGGVWNTFGDGYSSIMFTPNAGSAYAGSFCRSADWSYVAGNPSGTYEIAQTTLNNTGTSIDLSAYAGVRFYAKGAGSYNVQLPIDGTRTTYNHYTKMFASSGAWKLYELPFSSFAQTWGAPVTWNPAAIYAVAFMPLAGAGSSGSFQIDNVEFYTQAEALIAPADPNVILLPPKVNQEGYLPGENKYFCVVTNTASTGMPYHVLDAGNNTVFTGSITGLPFDDRVTTGEGVWKVDFSSFNAPGNYYITVNGKASCPFSVADNAYDSLFKDALRAFYLIRCGLAENDGVTGISRPACHTAAATIRGTAITGDFSGGWHNADDFGIYVNETAISVAYMLWLYELKTSHMRGLNNNIPETGNGFSDLLNEAKWGLNWMLKMQRPDGTVLHKVDSEPNLPACIAPDADPYVRFAEFQKSTDAQIPSTIDAADFVGVMAQAGRVFKYLDPPYSAQCLAAAQKAWAWAAANTKTAQSDPYYTDPAQWQEYMWAEAEMARLQNDQSLRDSFSAKEDTNPFSAAGWGDPQIFGYMALYMDQNTPQSLKDKTRQKVYEYCQAMLLDIQNSGYSADLKPAEYYWESNETLMHRACALLFSYEMDGGNTTQFKDAALMQLNYMLGLNSLNKSFIMSHGSNPMMKPWNCIYLYYNKSLPGWCAGGANQYATGADPLLADIINSGAPRAKCYIDAGQCGAGSWADNEGETSENAALLFLSGYFYSVTYPGSDPGPAGQYDTSKPGAFPSPCDLRKGDKGITFFNMPEGASLQVYNLKGELVHKAQVDDPAGMYYWDLSGQGKSSATAPGVYVFTVTRGKGFLKRGKFAIIR